jgi:NADH-quinone oxidoreductase subunit M
MGGLAMRAPILAALFLIATMALLAIPGSSNFVGEFYILNGIFQAKIVYAFVAAIGIVLAAYYALRLFQHAMHNRKPEGIESREIGWRQGAVVTALVACIIGIALWPGLILHRTNNAAIATVATTCPNPSDLPAQGPIPAGAFEGLFQGNCSRISSAQRNEFFAHPAEVQTIR